MKRFVRSEIFQAIYVGLGALLLVGVVQQETVVSALIVIGVLLFTIQQAWAGWRSER
ncbi:MAG TPA: hypothetical protein VF245_05670 [Solirubrobacterales bacterium]